MSDVVIRARNLKKVYRLYAGPGYRFLDMFGLLGNRPGTYTEHAALDGVSLDISRGAKVAIIGRNGAGKSTFLKLVTNVIQPTSGELEVKGKAHALLQIGSGFHPDFTGRENVYAYLAQLGVAGKEADLRCREIVEFAELEEYIEQPVKTYSSGMAVRLMFSTSTAISPDLLVLDEVLGVGDAYFAHKSYNRIRELCERDGTTLLLVTHDIYSAVNICERLIWIDRGRILMDGEGAAVVNAYEDSIRLQEEQRLRLKAAQRFKELAASDELTQVVIEVRAAGNVPQPCPVYFSRVDLRVGDATIGSLPLGGVPTPNASLQSEGTNWGDAVNWQGRQSRALQNFGSSFHKIAGTISVPRSRNLDSPQLSLELDYWSDQECSLVARCFVDGREISLGHLPPTVGRWNTHRAVPIDATLAARAQTLTPAGRQGTGAIVVESVTPKDSARRESYAFRHGELFELHIAYRINQPGLKERPQVLVAFHRDGVQDVMRVICREFLFDEQESKGGVIVMRLPCLPLANGTYSITVMVAREGYYDEQQTVYFSINPGVYTCLTRAFDITVEHGGIVGTGTGVVGEGEWSQLT
jgi:ABC-type polysaccharide/polyol phosphate transport system ATPase subunit